MISMDRRRNDLAFGDEFTDAVGGRKAFLELRDERDAHPSATRVDAMGLA